MPRIEEIALVSINIRIWKYLAILYPNGENNWRKYAFVLPVCLMNILQFIYLQRMWGDPPAFILNAFFFSAIFNALMRTLLVIAKRVQFEEFLGELQRLYEVIWATEDDICCGILQEAEREARDIAIFNLCASFLDITGAVVFSLFSKDKVHPFGIALPQVDMTRSPVYEIFYILEIPTPIVLSIMYMPFVSLFAAFALFGRAMLQMLSHKLSRIKDLKTSEERYQMLTRCIDFHSNVVKYVRMFNDLVTFIVGAEAIIFGSIICSLLFCLNLIHSSTQMISVIMYIFTMLYVLFTYYNRAQDLVVESNHVSEAVYDVPWYECDIRFRKTLLIFLMQTQRTLVILILVFWLYVYAPFHFISRQIKVGNVYPMTLAMFQSLLNASYSYFTMLRGVTNK